MPSGKQHATAQIVQQPLDLRDRVGETASGSRACMAVRAVPRRDLEARSHNERMKIADRQLNWRSLCKI